MGFLDWLFSRTPDYPIKIIGYFVRTHDDVNKRTSMEFVEDGPKPYDVITRLWNNPQKNIIITGQAGNSGKSTFLEALLNEVTDEEKSKKYQIDEFPLSAVIFSPKHFDHDIPIDYDLGGRFRVVDVRKEMINPFEDISAHVACWEVMIHYKIPSRGIMADQIPSLVGTILRESPCNSWADFRRNLEKVRKRRGNGLQDGELNYIEDKLPYLAIDATVKDIPISQVLFYLGGLEEEWQRAWYYELYLQKLAREFRIKKQEKKPLLILDEGHLILKFQTSIIARYLRELRTHVSGIWIATQNWADVNPNLRMTSFIPTGKTEQYEGFESKPTLNECITKLETFWFIDFAFTGSDHVPVYSVTEKAVEEIAKLKKDGLALRASNKDDAIENSVTHTSVIPSGQGQALVQQTQPTITLDEIANKILVVLENGQFALTRTEIVKQDNTIPDDVRVVHALERKLLKQDSVGVKRIVIRNKEVNYYYLPRTEQVHNVYTRESKKHFGNWQIIFEATQGTGKSDFILKKGDKKIAIECETKLKRDTSDLQSRITKNHDEGMKTIIVVGNTSDKEFYQSLFDCDVLLIPEIEARLKEFEK